MKKFVLTVLIVLGCLQTASAQTSIDIRFDAGKSPVQSVTLVHNQESSTPWQGFIKVFPNNTIIEAGPKFQLNNISLAIRIGAHLKTSETKLEARPQAAIVLSGKFMDFSFVSINEFSSYKGTEYFYEHEIRYGQIAAHVEAIFINKRFEPFLGPVVYPKIASIPGNIYFSFLKRINGPDEIVRVGYKISF